MPPAALSPRPAPARWLAAAGLAAALALGLCLRQINDPDTWTHLALGRAFLAAGTPFVAEPFRGDVALPAPAADPRGWLEGLLAGPPEWPFQVGLAALERTLGAPAISAALALLAAALVARLMVRVRRAEDPALLAAAAALAVAAVLAARFRLTPRPEAPACLLLLLALATARRWTERPGWWRLAALGALLLGWRTLHPTWTIGAAFALALVAARPRLDFWRAQPRGVLLALAAAGALAALEVARFGLLVLSELRGDGLLAGVTEMRPAWEFPSVLWPFLAVAAVALAAASVGVEGRWWRLAAWAAALLLGLVVVRNVAMAVLVQAFVALDGLPARAASSPARAGRRLLALAAPLAALLVVVAARDRDPPPGLGVDWRWFPREAAAFVTRAGLRAPVFNSWDHGGYLAWAWRGRPPTFLDGRLEPRDRLADHDALVGASAPERVIEARGLQTILLEPLFRNSGRVVPAVGWLLARPEWRLVEAADALVFAREPLPPGVVALGDEALFDLLLRRAALLETQGEPPPHAPFTRAVAWLRLGDAARAERAWREGVAASPALAAEYPGLLEAIRAAAR